MSDYDIDLEIVYAIKNGNHHYGKIWNKVKGIRSKQTFTDHLKKLVEDKVILRKIEDKTPYYKINEVEQYDLEKLMEEKFEKKINEINNISKKVPDKKVLDIFVNDTIRDLGFYSIFYFDTRMPHFESDKNIFRKDIEMLDSLIKARINFLEKRHVALLIPFNKLVKNQMFKKFDEQ